MGILIMDALSFKKTLLKHKLAKDFIFHDLFVEEFVTAVTNSGEEQLIVKQLIRKLLTINSLDNLNCRLKWLELLKNCGLYSLHIDTKSKNYRLLFSIEKSGKIFLRFFDEKAGKKTTSYSKNIQIALERKLS